MINLPDIQNNLASLAKRTFEDVIQLDTSLRFSPGDRNVLGEKALSAFELVKHISILPDETALLEVAFNNALTVLYNYVSLYNGFYYSARNLRINDVRETQKHFYMTNLSILAMRIKIRSHILGFDHIGGSEDRYFFDRISNYLQGLDIIFDNSRQNDYIPALYGLSNLHQTLWDYLQTGDTTFTVEAQTQFEATFDYLVKRLKHPSVRQAGNTNWQIKLFLSTQYKLHEKPLNILDALSTFSGQKLPNEQMLRSLSSLAILDSSVFVYHFERCWLKIASGLQRFEPKQLAFLIRILIEYLRINDATSIPEIAFKIEMDAVDITPHIGAIINGYNEIPRASLDKEDLTKLYALSDQDIRDRLSKIIAGVDPVVLLRQANKPHTGYEIADMELPIDLEGQRVFLYIPVKSGVEIKDKVDEKYLYQLIRPFTHISRQCAVIFVTARECTQPLMNSITRLRANVGWSIEVIQSAELAKLFKVNNLLN